VIYLINLYYISFYLTAANPLLPPIPAVPAPVISELGVSTTKLLNSAFLF
jgi:hypothetical protein